MRIRGRSIVPGKAEGDVLFTDYPITFYGGVDMRTGKIVQSDHPLRGESIAGKILVFPHGVGSTVGSYVIFGLKRYGKAPLAMVVGEIDTVVATGVILADIPTVEIGDIERLRGARRLRMDNDVVEILE